MADRTGNHQGLTLERLAEKTPPVGGSKGSSAAGYPRSGVSGLTPYQVRFRLLGNGWPVLPIVRHDLAEKSAGKKPSILQWERFAAYNADLPTLDDLNLWEGDNRRAPGTGIATGDLVAVDLDFLHDPTTAKRAYNIAVEIFGETPFVRVGQPPKAALIYRAGG